MEINIPNMDGIQATTTIKAKHPAIPTLVDKDVAVEQLIVRSSLGWKETACRSITDLS
jgi:hypothetical protein